MKWSKRFGAGLLSAFMAISSNVSVIHAEEEIEETDEIQTSEEVSEEVVEETVEAEVTEDAAEEEEPVIEETEEAVEVTETVEEETETESYEAEEEPDTTAVDALNAKIAALPTSLLGSTDIAADYKNLLSIKAEYDALGAEDQAKVDFTKAETLLDFNSDTLNPENLEKGNSLEGKVIGYLGSSITQGFRSNDVAFPEYITQLTGSTKVKQALAGGTLAAVPEDHRGYERSYIYQLLNGELQKADHLDALVVQLSTNDVSNGIPLGELSESYDINDLDNTTVIGAMEYITAYAREKWNCPTMFYINAYLSDEACEDFAQGDEATLKVLHEQYQGMYEQMIDALYKIVDKWDLGITDLWNDEDIRKTSLELRKFFMDDPIHPHKVGYYFWYTQPIMEELETIIAENEALLALQEKIDALPDTLLKSEDIAEDYAELLNIKKEYEALDDADQAKIDYTKAETLLDFNSDTLNPENLEKGNSLEGKVIGYLGSSITQGFRSNGVAFPEYIAQLSGSTSVKQAIPGGTLALKEGYREEVCYINQLLDGALTDVDHLDALVVQLSTNDVSAGIPIGELSDSFSADAQDYTTIIGAMEYICAYAKEKWNCPTMFYINAYLSDEACQAFANGDEKTLKLLYDQYQGMYEEMIDALYQVADKWDLGVTDLWNDADVRSASLDLRNFFMDDPIHPHKAGYYFWYTEPIMEEIENIIDKEDVEHVFVYDAAAEGKTSDYSSVSAPKFIVYPGALEDKTADKLIEELGIKEIADKYAGSVTVVTPSNGKAYTAKDSYEFVDLLGFAPSAIKVIGIDDGATFVNNYVSQKCWAVSGIMTYGGEMNTGLDYNVPVPVYMVNPSNTAKAYYENANAGEELAYTEIGTETDPASAFKSAWDKVLKKVYRQHNETTEFYNIPASAVKDPYPLYASVIDMEETYGVNYYTHYNEPMNGSGKYTWFEYIPQSTLEAEDGTVPLVVTLHGNGNDARIQGETTGWVELAAEEGFMVVAPEWQTRALVEGTSDTKPNFFNCDGLEKEKLIEWIEMLEEKYPQIDPSRIYVTGLSAGASASTLYGALYSDVFAAVGAVSGPGVDKAELENVVKTYKGGEVPWLYICGDHDFFGMIPVDGSSTNSFQVAPGVYIQSVDPASSMFSFIRSYQKINGLDVSKTYDMSLNEYYGIKFDKQEWIKLGFKDALEGTLANENGDIIKMLAIKDQAHWNYKPEAAYIWDFFKDYARDTETGELIRENENIVTKVENVGKDNVYLYQNKRVADENTENFYNSAYIVYADEKINIDDASQLLRDLGMVENMEKYGWNAIVAGPMGDTYGKADADLFPKLLDASGSMFGVKVIGVGKGADFVNEYITEKDWAISGYLTIDASNEADYGDIPAYATSTDKETLSEAFANGWDNALNKTLKIGNITGTFYTMPLSKERPFELAPWTETETLGFTRTVVKEDLDGDGKDSLWYEYVPKTASRTAGSVPMVLLLHGNTNDPRTQFETSGWAQVAAKEGIILIEPEWQGTSFGADPMTENDSTTKENDIVTMLEKVFEKYPQIDKSRVYVEGLSRGSLNTMTLILTHPEIFAAGGSHSGAVIGDLMSSDDLTDIIAEEKDQYDMPWYFIAGTEDGFVPVSQKGGENSGVLQALNLFEELNEMDITKYEDLDESKVEWFGFTQMKDFGEVENSGSCVIKGGTIKNKDGQTMLSFNAVENWGHWNYAPDAELMWNFFQNYSRDPETGELHVSMATDLTENDYGYVYDRTAYNTVDGRLSYITPTYLIYPDAIVDKQGAAALLEELGIIDHINEYDTKAYVINPVGRSYDLRADTENYLNLLNELGFAGNVKVIGIGNGADFVNKAISDHAWAVAGIMVYGGKATMRGSSIELPAYLSSQYNATNNYYISGNGAEQVSSEDGVTLYQNPDNALLNVAVANDTTLAEAFENAWKYVFSKNYRMFNEEEECYTAGLTKYTDPYQIIPYPMYDELGLTYESKTGLITSNATEAKPNQWYEVLPEEINDAEEASIPLLVVLHGNGNDNRTQLETSGWATKAGEERFAIIAPEWQASRNTVIFNQYTALGEQGTVDLVKKVLADYPQLDPSRVYVQGLSAGANAAYTYALNHSDVFTASQGSSSPFMTGSAALTEKANEVREKKTYLPTYVLAGTADVYKPIPTTRGNGLLQAYAAINDIDVPAEMDFNANRYYGIQLDDQGYYDINGQNVLAGTLSNSEGVMMKVVAMEPYAHWNNPRMIDDIWEFFSNYRRNPETGKIEVQNKFLFDDVQDPEKSFYEPVYWAYKNGITTGTSEEPPLFSPFNTCTRAQFVTFLWRQQGKPEPTLTESPFTDVQNKELSYYKAVLWAVENNITTGTSETTFDPGKKVTRAQAVTFLWRANSKPAPKTTVNPFADVKAGLSYSDAVVWAFENEITTGTSDTTFNPGGDCTRGATVTFLYRTYGKN